MKKLLSTTLTLLLVIGLGTSTLKAEDKTKPKHDADTGVTVTFGEKIVVIDPDNPDTDPEEVDPGSDSAIQIWKVPGELKFSAKRSNKEQVVELKKDTEDSDATYGVFDFHSETPGWQLSAKLSHLTEASGAREENLDNLEGASLQWTGDNIKRVTINSDNNRHTEEANDVTGLEDVQLVTGGEPVNLMNTSGVKTGNKGHFEGKMKDLKLVIPAFQGNPNTNYMGTITWKLQSSVITKGE